MTGNAKRRLIEETEWTNVQFAKMKKVLILKA